MDLATIDISPEEAKDRLADYEEALRRERSAEDEAIAAGYRAAARGLPVISLSQTMAAGEWFPNGLPRLAVCRADAHECYVRVHGRTSDRRSVTFTDREWDRGRARIGAYRVQVDMPRPAVVTNEAWRGRTIVPLVPPQHRPRRPRLGRFHILWEVEQWTLIPPRDPALLRHIQGDLWAVMAVWDLTDLERAVLFARGDS
jgi:hypothetical protein